MRAGKLRPHDAVHACARNGVRTNQATRGGGTAGETRRHSPASSAATQASTTRMTRDTSTRGVFAHAARRLRATRCGRAAGRLFGCAHRLRDGVRLTIRTLFESDEHGRLDAMRLRPDKNLGGRVAAAACETLLGRGTAAGFVHTGERPRTILGGETLGDGRFGSSRRDARQRQRQARGHERVAENRQPCRDPTKRCV